MITIDSPSYRFPIIRLYSGFAILLLADLISSLFLWVSTTDVEKLRSSIISFEIKNSTFDLACIGFFRGLLMIITLAKLENMTIAASQDGIKNEKPRKLISFFGFVIFLGTFVYTAYKDLVVLKDKNSSRGIKFYALCISCFVFGTLELLVYVKFLYHLKHLQKIYSCLKNEDTTSNLPAKKKVNFLRLMKLTYPELLRLFIGMLGLFCSTGSKMIAPLFFGYVIQAASAVQMDALNKQILLLFLIYMIGSVGELISTWQFSLAGQSIVATLRKNLFKHIIKQEIAFFDLNRTGELTNRLASDTEVITSAICGNISKLLENILQIIGSLIIMLAVCPKLAGLLLAVVPLVGIAIQKYGNYVENMQKKLQDDLANAATNAEETLSSMRTVRGFSQELKAEAEYNKGIDASFLTGKKLSLASGCLNMFFGVVVQGNLVLVLWYGGKLVIDGDMNIGELFSFIMYSFNLIWPFAILSSVYGDFMKAAGASIRIYELLDRVPEIKSGSIIVNTKDNITFDNVEFSYPTRPETKVLKSLSFNMKPGETIALVGPSGGGKTTVMSLLERFYDPCYGTIYFGNHDLKSVNLDMLRKKMSIVSQEPILFATTIANNIAYGIDASQDEIEFAAKQANAHDFIMSFEEGYNTYVGERGIKLSGGQKQRVAIARALLMNPDILLLDEATSALDSESEHLVQEAIDRAMIGKRTVLVIAHRLSTVRHASRVIVINKGVVAEEGTHDELIQANGVYKKLVLRQLEKGRLQNETNDDLDVDELDSKI
ncbi:uncharacterized protein LOC101234644 isoform X1 [Hydra vulgaris]|uniref:uncharacterized protein LOC101234644 isoform X1 n=1 Tax=Hydra vulgaris TaxID=6087 RepID=UPI001F5EB62E|nr:ABC transporter B family member 25-like [Hydra vulgaris]